MANSSEHTIKQYQLGKEIGKGNFGTVCEAVFKPTSTLVAIKIIKKECLDEYKTKLVKNEIQILRELKSHPNIVQFLCAFEDCRYYYIVTELCRTDLDHKLKSDPSFFKLVQVKRLMKQIVNGLYYLKERHGIIHRDIKLSNLLLDGNDNVKIADFGMAVHNIPGKRNTTFCGTPNYMAREMVLREPHGFEADMWSLGCVLYTMLVGKSAFGGRDVQNTFEKIALAELEIPSSKVPYEASDLIKRLIEPVKEKRMQLHDVLKHQFLADVVEVRQENHKNYDTTNRAVSQMSGYSSQSAENMTLCDVQESHNSKPHQLPSDKLRGRHHALMPSESATKLPPDRSKPPVTYAKYRGSKRSHSAEPLTHANVPHNLSLMSKVSDSGTDVSKSRNFNTKGISRFNCARIKYTRKRLKFGMITITKVPGNERPTNEVYFEIIKEHYVSEVMKISEDGTEVSFFQLRVPSLLEDQPIVGPTSAQQHYRFDNLPDHLRKYYRYVSKLIDLLQSMTPKVTIYSSEAKCMIMENLNYKAEFYDGTVIEKDSKNTKLIPAEGGELKNVESQRHNLSTEMLHKLDSALKMHSMLIVEESNLRKKEATYCYSLFPATYGSRPRSNVALKTEPTNLDIKSESPLPVNSGGSINLRSQDSGFLSNKSDLTKNSKQSSDRGQNLRRTCMEFPDIGRVTQLTDQKISVQTIDGWDVILNSDTKSWVAISPDGRKQGAEHQEKAQKVLTSIGAYIW